MEDLNFAHEFAHELKQKLKAVRPALDDESLAAQFDRALEFRFPQLSADDRQKLFDAEFERVPASVKIKQVEVAPDAGDLEEPGV